MTIPPASTIGIIGGGQLGRMLSIAAAQLGYRCHIFDPGERPPAADVAACHTRAAFDDLAALQTFGAAVDVATYEFENLPVAPLATLGEKLLPGARSLAIAQDRATEKEFIEQCGARVAPWRAVASLAEVENAIAELGTLLVLKTRRYGYDGKGQAWVRSPAEAASAWAAIREEAAVAEASKAHGPARVLVNCAGIGVAKRVIGRDGAMPLSDFDKVIKVNLIGSFNMLRLATAEMSKLEPLANGERGVVINTASVAAYDGQIGQAAYSASKGGIVAMTLPIARELAQFGIRVLTIAPGLFLTPLLANLPQEAQDSLAAAIPFPRRLGHARRVGGPRRDRPPPLGRARADVDQRRTSGELAGRDKGMRGGRGPSGLSPPRAAMAVGRPFPAARDESPEEGRRLLHGPEGVENTAR